MLSPTGLKCSTSNCGSKPTGNKKNDRISRTPSRDMKNKVEAQPRKVSKKNSVVEPIHDVDVKHSLLNANSEPIYATCKKSIFDGVHEMCLLHFVENVNSRAKSAKKHKKQNIWKPTGKTFTIVGNSCPLIRITSANVVPSKKTNSHSVETQKPELKSKLHKSSLKFGQIACFVPNVTKVQGSSLCETFGASIVPVGKPLGKPLVQLSVSSPTTTVESQYSRTKDGLRNFATKARSLVKKLSEAVTTSALTNPPTSSSLPSIGLQTFVSVRSMPPRFCIVLCIIFTWLRIAIPSEIPFASAIL
ncbi:hypothetical protein Tco_1189190 [Tanacetum coccineum]